MPTSHWPKKFAVFLAGALFLGLVALCWLTLAHEAGRGPLFGNIAAAYFSSVFVVGAVFAIEALEVGWQNSSLRAVLVPRAKSAWHDVLTYVLVKAGVFDMLTEALSLGLTFVGAYLWARLGQRAWPEGVSLRTGLFVTDLAIYHLGFTFFDYWSHRLFHARVLWPLHRLHHSATELTVLTAARNHPLAAMVDPLLRQWPAALLGMPPNVAGAYSLQTTAWHHLIHSRVPWSFGWAGRWLVVSPRGHAIHHGNEEEFWNKNISLCPLWDRLFGTWYTGDRTPAAFGTPEPAHATRNLFLTWILDARDFGRALFGREPTRRATNVAPSPSRT